MLCFVKNEEAAFLLCHNLPSSDDLHVIARSSWLQSYISPFSCTCVFLFFLATRCFTLKIFNLRHLLHHTNGQMYKNITALSIEIIGKHNVFAVCWFKSTMVVSCLDLYVFLGCYLQNKPLLKSLSCIWNDILLDHFPLVLIHITNYEMCKSLCLKKHLTTCIIK